MSTDLGALSIEFGAMDEATLEQQLGMRLAIAHEQPTAAALEGKTFSANVSHLGIADDAKQLGRRLYVRISHELHELFCGSSNADAQDREKISKAIGLGDGLVAAITGVLVSSFGLMPAIAAILAALLAKRIFEPAGDEVCSFWTEKLPK